MTERMHPEDLRALVAAHIYGLGVHLIQGQQWQNVNDYHQTVLDADALLVELARTANPEPDSPRLHACRDCQQSEVEALARAEAAEVRVVEAGEHIVASDATIARLNAQLSEAANRITGIDDAKAAEPPMPTSDRLTDPGFTNIFVNELRAWGRQGWDAAAALRMDAAHAQEAGAMAERKRIQAALANARWCFLLHDGTTARGYRREDVDWVVSTSVPPVQEVRP